MADAIVVPVIRDIDVYDCEGLDCSFWIYFNPPPEGVDVEIYLNYVVATTSDPEQSGDLTRVSATYPRGMIVVVRVAFRSGSVRSWSHSIYIKNDFPLGIDTEIEPVISSSIKAVGWIRSSSTAQLTADQVGTLFVNEEISEEDARSRFRNLGYSDEDIEHLILLNAPY